MPQAESVTIKNAQQCETLKCKIIFPSVSSRNRGNESNFFFYVQSHELHGVGVWQIGNRTVQSPTLGRETIPDISCEWNTKFSIIPEIPSKRVHSKRIPKFSKPFPGIFTVPFNLGPEISEIYVEWKAPIVYGPGYLSVPKSRKKLNLNLT